MRKYIMKKILAAVLCAVLILSLCACTNTENTPTDEETNASLTDVTVVLDWTPNTNHSGLYAALENGYYEEEGLNVSIVQPPEDGAEALVASGKAQFGISFQDTMATALTADEPLDIVAVAAVVQHNLSGIISRGDKNITSFKDMASHSYATWGNPIEQAIIKSCVEKDGGNFDDVNLVDTYVTDVMTALDTDLIDTVWVYEYWDVIGAKVANYDYNYIDFKDVDPVFDYYTPVIISSGEYLNSNSETAKKFLKATAKGYEFCAANPEEAAEILLNASPELDRSLVEESAKFMSEYYLDENGEWGTIDPERWADFYSWLYSESLTDEDLKYKGLDNGYLK
jgi:ABC-type nitrate/sulfonate/bicarbonate transport system substrate-binding protein